MNQIQGVESARKPPFMSYAIIIAFLLGAVLLAYEVKTGGVTNWFKGKPTASVPNQPLSPPDNPLQKADDLQVKALRADFERMKAENKQQFADIDRRIKWNGDRITLLATVQQENFLQIRNGQNNFIYFNADWTIDRLPQYLELTQDDKDFLNKYLKKGEE